MIPIDSIDKDYQELILILYEDLEIKSLSIEEIITIWADCFKTILGK